MSAVPHFSNLCTRLGVGEKSKSRSFFIRLEIIDFDKANCKKKKERKAAGNLYSPFLSRSVTHHRGPFFSFTYFLTG